MQHGNAEDTGYEDYDNRTVSREHRLQRLLAALHVRTVANYRGDYIEVSLPGVVQDAWKREYDTLGLNPTSPRDAAINELKSL